VVQRKPRHGHVLVRVDLGGVDDGIEVGGHAAVRHHHALRVGGGAARELQDRQRVRIVGGAFVPVGRAAQLVEPHDGWVVRLGIEELAELRVDHHDLRAGVHDQAAGLGDEVLDRAQPHRERQHDHGRARQPRRLDGGDE
jgi:hypothetical protein